jgi:A/G-specific adenine glycosylase
MTTLLQQSRTGNRFRAALLRWYDANKRDLPWRRTRDPFRIWVSEIMLQQTRVAAVLDHYQRFFQQFPSLAALARAREQHVLTAWSGLGYYRRARMLHRAAKEVVGNHNGRIPRTAAELQQLPGIGRYTAAAIASIAFEEPVAVVDGNVERVLSRISGQQLGVAACWEQAQRLVSPDRPGDFNQAMMELGATICLPQSPICGSCPIKRHCSARGHVPNIKPRAAQNRAQRNLVLVRRPNAILLKQRSRSESVMPGLWDLPEHAESTLPILRLKHSIMNTDYDVRVYAAESQIRLPGTRWVRLSRLSTIPLTGMSRKALRRLNLLQ